MKLIENATERAKDPFLQVCIYGLGGSRKTWLATHLPTQGPTWTGKVIYIAADKTSPKLDSITPKDRERLLVYIPDGTPTWVDEMKDLCLESWKKKHPEACALVYDTVSATARRMLAEVDARVPKPDRQKMEDRASYGNVQSHIANNIDNLLTFNQDLHVFCLFHEALAQAKDGYRPVYGPYTVGQTGPRQMPQNFGVNLWLEVESQGEHKGSTRITMRDTGQHIANIKGAKPEDVPESKHLGTDPNECRSFWSWLQRFKSG